MQVQTSQEQATFIVQQPCIFLDELERRNTLWEITAEKMFKKHES